MTYYYMIITKADKIPLFEGVVGISAADYTAAYNWVVTYGQGYDAATTSIYLRLVDTSEAGVRGIATKTGVGEPTDATIAAGADGSLNAKVKLLTSQIDQLIKDLGPYTAVQYQVVSVSTTAVELKGSTTRLASRQKLVVLNQDGSITLYVGKSTVSSTSFLKSLPAASLPYEEKFGDIPIYGVVASGTINVLVVELGYV